MVTEWHGRLRVGVVLVAACALVGLLVASMDMRRAEHVLVHAAWEWALVGLAATATSYVCLSAAYASLNRMFGTTASRRDLVEIGLHGGRGSDGHGLRHWSTLDGISLSARHRVLPSPRAAPARRQAETRRRWARHASVVRRELQNGLHLHRSVTTGGRAFGAWSGMFMVTRHR